MNNFRAINILVDLIKLSLLPILIITDKPLNNTAIVVVYTSDDILFKRAE